MEKGCPSCGRMVDSSIDICPYCNYNFRDNNNLFNQYEKERLRVIEIPKYAGFIKRVVASGIDLTIWTFIFIIITSIYIFYISQDNVLNTIQELISGTNIEAIKTIEMIWLFMPLCYFFYCVFRQYSKKFATIGQRMVGIEVVNEDDDPLTLKAAFSHNLARLLNIITLGLGFLIIIFTKKKQALSDMVTHTYVINRVTDEDYSAFRYANPFIRFLAYILDMAFLDFISFAYVYIKDAEFIPDSEIKNVIIIMLGILLFVYILVYFPYMESKYGATLGKRVFNIKVVRLNGEKISFFKSIVRMILLNFESIIFLSPLLSFVTPRKQTLKDIMTKTIVINTR